MIRDNLINQAICFCFFSCHPVISVGICLNLLNWLPGVCRGLVATAGGQVRAENCHATRWWIRLEGHRGPRMSRSQAQALMARLENML